MGKSKASNGIEFLVDEDYFTVIRRLDDNHIEAICTKMAGMKKFVDWYQERVFPAVVNVERDDKTFIFTLLPMSGLKASGE